MSGEIVIGVFGSDLRLLGPEGRVSAHRVGDAEEIPRAVAGAFPKAKRARIVWQPDSLEVREAAAGESDRGPSGDLPADCGADHAGAVWSFEPGDGNTGFLHIERNSGLPALANGLARSRIRVDGAWPLYSLFETGAPDGRGRLILVATSSRAYVFCGSPSGSRFLRTCAASDSAGLRGAVRDAVARFDEADAPEGWLVAEDGPAEALAREIASAHSLKELPLADFLGRAARLEPGGPGDFLRRPSLFSRRRRPAVAAAAAGLVLLAAAAIHAGIASKLRRQRTLSEERQRAEERLEAAKSFSLKRKIDALQKGLDRLRIPRQRDYELLLALARAAPENVRLTSLSIENESFTASGSVGGPGAANPWTDFLRNLAPPGAPWQLRDPRLSPDQSAAVIRGSFQEDAGDPAAPGAATPREAARLERDFESARSRLPTAEACDDSLRELGRTWNVRAGPVERFDGIEIRGYALSWVRPRLEAWSDILATIQALCEQPGLTVQRLDLAADPGADAFSKAEVDLLLRLRLPGQP